MRTYLRSELLFALERHLEAAPLDDMLKAIVDLGLTVTLFSDEQSLLQVQVASEGKQQEAGCNECNGCACEVQQETLNPFIERDKQKRAELAKLGLSDLQDWEQDKVIREAQKHIKEHSIEDEDERVKAHHRMRDHYLAYKAYMKSEK